MSEVKANRLPADCSIDELVKPGNFRWSGDPVKRLTFGCPCGCGDIAGIEVKPENPSGWDWNGDLDKPTVTPSILINRDHWHGYLTDGVFKSC